MSHSKRSHRRLRSIGFQREDPDRERLAAGRIVEHSHFKIAEDEDEREKPGCQYSSGMDGHDDSNECSQETGSRHGGRFFEVGWALRD
jgi:hypothetical protein